MKKSQNFYLVLCIFSPQKCNHDFSMLALLRVLAVFRTSPFYIHLGHMWTAAIVLFGCKECLLPSILILQRGSRCFSFPPLKVILKNSKYRTTNLAVFEQIGGYLFSFLKHKRPIIFSYFPWFNIYFFDTNSQSKRIKITHCWTLNWLACFPVCTLYILLDGTKDSLDKTDTRDLMQKWNHSCFSINFKLSKGLNLNLDCLEFYSKSQRTHCYSMCMLEPKPCW